LPAPHSSASHNFHSRESFFDRGRNELRGHQIERVLGYDPRSRRVARFTHFEGNVKPHSFGIAIVLMREFDEGAPIAAREIGRVYIGHGPAQAQALLKKIAHSSENGGVNHLVRFIVGQLHAHRIA
jgi:hypothetical protein